MVCESQKVHFFSISRRDTDTKTCQNSPDLRRSWFGRRAVGSVRLEGGDGAEVVARCPGSDAEGVVHAGLKTAQSDASRVSGGRGLGTASPLHVDVVVFRAVKHLEEEKRWEVALAQVVIVIITTTTIII